jgi:hypothetical protein
MNSSNGIPLALATVNAPPKAISRTNGVHGDDLRRGALLDSTRGDDERGIATMSDDHLPTVRGGKRALRFGFDLAVRHGNERGRLLRIEDKRVHFHSGLDELGSQRRRIENHRDSGFSGDADAVDSILALVAGAELPWEHHPGFLQ